jgi:hypothetical protein
MVKEEPEVQWAMNFIAGWPPSTKSVTSKVEKSGKIS